MSSVYFQHYLKCGRKAVLIELESGRSRILQPATVPFWLCEVLGIFEAQDKMYEASASSHLMLTAIEDLTVFMQQFPRFARLIQNQ